VLDGSRGNVKTSADLDLGAVSVRGRERITARGERTLDPRTRNTQMHFCYVPLVPLLPEPSRPVPVTANGDARPQERKEPRLRLLGTLIEDVDREEHRRQRAGSRLRETNDVVSKVEASELDGAKERDPVEEVTKGGGSVDLQLYRGCICPFALKNELPEPSVGGCESEDAVDERDGVLRFLDDEEELAEVGEGEKTVEEGEFGGKNRSDVGLEGVALDEVEEVKPEGFALRRPFSDQRVYALEALQPEGRLNRRRKGDGLARGEVKVECTEIGEAGEEGEDGCRLLDEGKVGEGQ
jgi:hypothetical protein